MTATLSKADGTRKEITPENGKTFNLREIQTAVGGCFEFIGIQGGAEIMLLNDEGRLRGLPLNEWASELAGQQIVGDVIVCSHKMLV